MLSASKPRWQHVTALVSLGASGTITGFSFVPSSPADLMSPTSMPIRLMALERSAQPAASGDAALRSAIVNVATYYLRMAQGKTPAEMEATIWQHDSIDGVDHGESCAAFASLTLELAAQVVGQQSWVTGGTSYPWPLHKWADVRVDPNPSSPNIISVLQDAEAHGRWHPLGDGYQPQPGDWVLFDGHVEVVTNYAQGVLSTIGGDSLPNFSVNAHEYPAPLSAQGVVGFVNNGDLASAGSAAATGSGSSGATGSGSSGATGSESSGATGSESAAVPGAEGAGGTDTISAEGTGSAAVPGTIATAAAGAGTPAFPATGASAAQTVAGSEGTGATGASAAQTVAGAGGTGAPRIPGTAATGSAGPNAAATANGAAIPGALVPTPVAGNRSQPAGHGRARDHERAQGRGQAQGQVHGPAGGASASPRANPGHGHASAWSRPTAGPGTSAVADAEVPGMSALSGAAATPKAATAGAAAIPGVPAAARHQSGNATPYRRHQPPAAAPPVQETSAQQAFIDEVAPGAIATRARYGIPASVTIAQAIDESGWGQSVLATQDYNLFGIKGTGPAGSDSQPTQEYENGEWVTINAPFRVYSNFSESIDDHAELLATSGYYTQAMADRNDPDAFADALTGVYATNPDYGSDLIQLMQQYDLYRYDAPAPATAGTPASAQARPDAHAAPSAQAPRGGSGTQAPSPAPTLRPGASSPSPSPSPTVSVPPTPAPSVAPSPTPTPSVITASSRPVTRAMEDKRPGRAQAARWADQLLSTTISSTLTAAAAPAPSPAAPQNPPRAEAPSRPRGSARPYRLPLPASVKSDFVFKAKAPLKRSELLHRDVASGVGISWQLLAACDWMQCEARPRYSPVHGEKLGTANPDGTVYRTRSEALEQCARDLAEFAGAVYGIDLTAAASLSVGDLAKVFAAFRWGGLLKRHRTSAMEFPYSVAGLTVEHLNMRWPNIGEPNAPDKPGGRFRGPFGAVPVVLRLNYPAAE
jgi:flagellum-specific peptidoglycan hydrolase FlgJ